MIETKALYWCIVMVSFVVLLAIFPPLAFLFAGALAVNKYSQRQQRKREALNREMYWTPEQIDRTYFS